MRKQKREYNGQYAFDGNLQRMCVCGHNLGAHGAGSPADCLLYSYVNTLTPEQKLLEPGSDHPNCGCQKFRLSRRKPKQ